MTQKTFSEIITFSRASSATRVNAYGLIETVPANTPRFDYDPVTLAPKGLLVERQRVNIVTYSEQLDNANWLKNNSLITANAITAPDGTTTADAIIDNSTYAGHIVSQGFTPTVAAYTLSVFIKKGAKRYIATQISGGGLSTPCYVSFDMDNSAKPTIGSGTPTITVQAYANGWYRVSQTVTFTTTASGLFGIYGANGPAYADRTYIGSGDICAYAWGAQIVADDITGSYIPTTASQVTRGIDSAVIGSPNFTPWFNSNTGTIVAEFTIGANNSSTNYGVGVLHDGTANNEIVAAFKAGSGSVLSTANTLGAVQVAIVTVATANVGSTHKTAFTYALNNFAACGDGGDVTSDTLGTVPVVDRLAINYRGNVGDAWVGHIRKISYYPSRLTDDQLKSLTT